MRGWIWSAGLVGGLARAAGCSEDPCFYGVYPYDGQTSVPLDAVLTFEAAGELVPDLPSLDGAIALHRVDGEEPVPVPFDIRVDPDTQLVAVLPREPLAPDATYELYGIDADLVETRHFPQTLFRWPVAVTFETTSVLRAAGAWRVGDAVVVALSQPADDGAIAADLVVGDAAGTPVAFEIAGRHEGEAVLVEIDDGGMGATVELGGEAVAVSTSGTSDLVPWYRSQPTCGYVMPGALR